MWYVMQYSKTKKSMLDRKVHAWFYMWHKQHVYVCFQVKNFEKKGYSVTIGIETLETLFSRVVFIDFAVLVILASKLWQKLIVWFAKL